MANPSWGFPTHMKQEKYAVEAVASVISRVFIAKRNTIKAAVRRLSAYRIYH